MVGWDSALAVPTDGADTTVDTGAMGLIEDTADIAATLEDTVEIVATLRGTADTVGAQAEVFIGALREVMLAEDQVGDLVGHTVEDLAEGMVGTDNEVQCAKRNPRQGPAPRSRLSPGIPQTGSRPGRAPGNAMAPCNGDATLAQRWYFSKPLRDG